MTASTRNTREEGSSLSSQECKAQERGDDFVETLPLNDLIEVDEEVRSVDEEVRSVDTIENASYPSLKALIVPGRHSTTSLFHRRRSRSIRHNNNSNNSNIANDLDFYEEGDGIDFLKDDPITDMTWGRRIGIHLSQYKWYNPRASDDHDKKYDSPKYGHKLSSGSDAHRDDNNSTTTSIGSSTMNQPSLKKAWAYFEHVILTRYVIEEHNTDTSHMNIYQRWMYSFQNYEEAFERAQPGEKHLQTKLYDPVTTPHMQLGDFGLGFGLYFSTLRAIGYITFVAGVISVFNLYFFASDRYVNERLTNPFLYGSAICTRTDFVPCIDCDCDDIYQAWPRTLDRCKQVYSFQDTDIMLPKPLTVTVKNRCLEDDYIIWKLGMINLGSMLFLLFSVLALGIYIEDQAVKFDEDEQTAQDYSIVISNPPPKATDPSDWKHYFEHNFDNVKVAAVTCAVNNDLLIRALVARREILQNIELGLKPGTPMDIDNLALLAAKEARSRYRFISRIGAWFIPGLPELLSQLVALNTRIKGLSQLSYPCTNVYVTFEEERDQRQVLSRLSVGTLQISRNNANALPHRRFLYNGKLVLDASEAVEPNSVRWQDLNTTFSERLDQMILTNILTFFIIIVVALIVTLADAASTIGAAFSIAGFNLAFPQLAKLVTDMESHPTESHLQTSLYFKIAAFRWVNTAIVITVITPFTKTLDDEGLIPQISAIFFAEIVTTNVIQLTDVWGHIQRHILAPRAKTQDTMNLKFQGLEVELAERYTNMTKIMFLTFWYSSIFPGALFLCSITLGVNYYTDRFSLMRSWKRAPHVSTEISVYSRHYFFSAACIFLAVMTSFYWAAFPFDNLCPIDDDQKGLNASYYGTHYFDAIDTVTNETIRKSISIGANSTIYRFCQQDYILRPDGFDFPFMYREGRDGGEWMTPEQKRLSLIFGWMSVAVMGVIAGKFVLAFYSWVHSLFYGQYDEVGEDQGMGFHDVRNISGYIPQVRSSIFSYPLLACNCDEIDQLLFDWTDPDREYAYYDLTKDTDHILTGSRRRARHSFSRVKHWPPTRTDDMKRRKRMLEMRIEKSRSIFNSSVTMHSTRGGTSTRRRLDRVRSSLIGSSKKMNASSTLSSGL